MLKIESLRPSNLKSIAKVVSFEYKPVVNHNSLITAHKSENKYVCKH
jgi:hypothetical protein